MVGTVKVGESFFEWQAAGQKPIRGSLMEIFSPSAWPGVDSALHEFLRGRDGRDGGGAHDFTEFQSRFGAEVVTKSELGGENLLLNNAKNKIKKIKKIRNSLLSSFNIVVFLV